VTLVWDLKWTGYELLEGHLDIVVSDGREQIGRIKIDGIVLSTGQRRFETRLPVFSTDGFYTQAMLHAVLVTADRRFDLGEFPLRFQQYGTRTMTVGISDPWGVRFSTRQSKLTQSLRLERFNPEDQDRSLTSSFGHLAPTEMPADALGYCVYNLVVLMDEGFSELRPKQLAALYDWVAAGGSVCIMPGGGLGADHVEFLNRLAARDEQASPLLLDSEGRLIPEGTDERATFRLLHPGVGRTAIVIAANDTLRNPESNAWREMVAFLWNVHAQWVPALARDGNWSSARIISRGDVSGYGSGSTRDKFEHRTISQGNWLLDRLMPESVKVVPLGLIGLILAAYVLLIGPVDYFLLGAFKQRKLTWILFPLVTVGVTLFTVWLSQWYMQPSEDRRTVEFLDVGDDGSIARRSRFELLFTSTPRAVETKVVGEIFAPFNQQRYGSRAQQMHQQYGNAYGEQEMVEQLVGLADYEGRIPADYTVTQQIPQWTPQINRFFSIRPDDNATKAGQKRFDWRSLKPSDSLTGPNAVRDHNWKDTVRRQVQQHFGIAASIWVMSGTNVDQIAGSPGLFVRQYNNYQNPYGRQVYDDAEEDQASGSGRDINFLTQTCRRPQVGLYRLVSRIAPTGGDTFEDLAFLDPTDPRQCLLVVAVEQEGNLKIYRKLYILSQ
jgi:hypothetical protein